MEKNSDINHVVRYLNACKRWMHV